MPDDRFLTVEETAHRLRVSPYTVREWLKSGQVRGVKIGRVWRVPIAALHELTQSAGQENAKPSAQGATEPV